MKIKQIIFEIESIVINHLANLEKNHVYSKSYLFVETQIPALYLDAVLKSLRTQGLIELDHRMNDSGMFTGSGYKLTSLGFKRHQSLDYLTKKVEHRKRYALKNESLNWFKKLFRIFT